MRDLYPRSQESLGRQIANPSREQFSHSNCYGPFQKDLLAWSLEIRLLCIAPTISLCQHVNLSLVKCHSLCIKTADYIKLCHLSLIPKSGNRIVINGIYFTHPCFKIRIFGRASLEIVERNNTPYFSRLIGCPTTWMFPFWGKYPLDFVNFLKLAILLQGKKKCLRCTEQKRRFTN